MNEMGSVLYRKIYDELGEDFLSHLNKGDFGATGDASDSSAKSIKVAKEILAQKLVEKTSNSYVKEARLTSVDIPEAQKVTLLFEIIKMIIANNRQGDIPQISNYGIAEMAVEQRIEIASIAIYNRPDDLNPQFLSAYGLADNASFFQFAMHLVTDPRVNLPNRITGRLTPEQLFEVAKKAAFHGNAYLSFNLDADQRFEIAKIAAANSEPVLMLEFLSCYYLSNDQNFEILKTIAALDGSAAIDKLSTFAFFFEVPYRMEIFRIGALEMLKSKGAVGLTAAFSKYPDMLRTSRFDKKVDMSPFKVADLLTKNNLTNGEILHCVNSSPYSRAVSHALEKICHEENTVVKDQLVKCLGAFLLICQLLNTPSENLERYQPIISELIEFRSPTYRYTLTAYIVDFLRSADAGRAWQNLFDLTENKPYTAILCMFLAPIIDEVDRERVANIVKTRAFQNTMLRNPVIQGLAGLANEPSYSAKDRQSVLYNLILQPPLTPASVLKKTQAIEFVLIFNPAALRTATLESLDSIVEETFRQNLVSPSTENPFEKFNSTFGVFQNPVAILRYAASLRKLRGPEGEPYMQCLQEFITSVLESDFPGMRYRTDNNVHLQEIFNSPAGEVLRREWQKGAIFEDAFSSDVVARREDRVFDVGGFLKGKMLQEGHLEKSDFPELDLVLTDPSQLNKIEQLLYDKLQSGTAASPEDFMVKKTSSFQLQVIKIMYPDPKSPLSNADLEQKLTHLLKMLGDIYRNKQVPAMALDLQEVIASFKAPQKKRTMGEYEGWVIRDTDHPERLLNIGQTPGGGTCQGIDKSPTTSKCLLSYLIDGKNRAIIVEDGQGQMQARAILRLLWDKTTKQPVLFIDTIYPEVLDAAINKAMLKACKQRAKDLNLPLVSALPTSAPYPNSLDSLGGRAPSEYVDSGNGVSENAWTIDNLYYVTMDF